MPLTRVRRHNFNRTKRLLRETSNQEGKRLAELVVEEHKKLIRNWKHQPTFTIKETGGEVIVTVEDDEAGRIWWWNNSGTGIYGPSGSPIEVTAKQAKFLRFFASYEPKNVPGSSGGPGKYSGQILFRKQVTIDGIEPRDFIGDVKKVVAKNRRGFLRRLANRFLSLFRR